MEFASLKPDKSIFSYSWNHQAHIATGPHFNLFVGENNMDHVSVIIKQVDRCNISDPEAFRGFLPEIQSISKKKLPGCVQYVDLVNSTDSFYFIQHFCNGGDFRRFLTKKGKIEETEAMTILSSLIKNYHSLNKESILHGRLSPENILLHNKAFILSDYGLHQLYQYFLVDKTKENSENFLYQSPQQLSNPSVKPNPKHDIWALGLIYYEMLYGTLPWTGKSKAEYLQTIRKIPIRFPFSLPLSEKSKDFLKGCLQVEESTRFSFDQLLRHPIYSGSGEVGGDKDKTEGPSKACNLSAKNVKVVKDLQNIIAKQNLDLEKLFNSFDKTGDKALDLHEFMKLVSVIQPKLEMADIQEVFQRFDENHDGNISFAEFKKLIVETDYRGNSENEQLAEFRGQKMLDHIVNIILENNLDLEKMISQFDVTGDGLLKLGEFLPIIRVFDKGISDEDGRFVFKKFDKNLDGELSYPEFKTILEIEIEKKAKNASPNKAKKKEMISLAAKIMEDLKKVIVFNKLDTKMVFKSFDKSGDSLLDFKEFQGLVAIINARHTESDIMDLFGLFDVNKDQNVSLEEFQKALLG